MVPSLYSERDLQDVWERQSFRREALLTEDARRVVVEFPGVRSVEGGPDFHAARLLIDGVRRSGDVEIHLAPSGWAAHGHDADGAYANVILHVVLRRDPFREPAAGPAPLLVLEPYLSAAAPALALEAGGDLDALGDAWFAARRDRIVRLVERLGADETLHREILVGLGYKRNQAAMAELARRCPWRAVAGRPAGEIEALYHAAAAALPPAMWRLRNVRPANHPRRRLSGMARFAAAAGTEGPAALLRPGRSSAALAAVLDPDGTGLIGPDRAREIALNVFVPFLGEAAWRAAAEEPPPPPPGALRRRLPEPPATVRRYFGALRLLRVQEFSLATPPGPC
ncbi:MAG TPA: DUF2851 family protein [Planctomycetota bacterium]